MFLVCSSQHLVFFFHVLFATFNVSINPYTVSWKSVYKLYMDSWFIKTGKSKLWILCPTIIGLENFLIKVINWESPSWGLTQLTAWPMCFRTPPTYVKPVVAEVPMLISVVGVMYMFISSPPETAAIWIISDVIAITKVKSDRKESTDSKVRLNFMTLNSGLSFKWNGYLPRPVFSKSKIISFPSFGKDTGVGSMSSRSKSFSIPILDWYVSPTNTKKLVCKRAVYTMCYNKTKIIIYTSWYHCIYLLTLIVCSFSLPSGTLIPIVSFWNW